ncbi:MAG: hypothetical protein FJ086_16800 [Deltaproteobacteria bacterium]|nr:hypothetical protein [Deltaproteobacteria bacterium]
MDHLFGKPDDTTSPAEPGRPVLRPGYAGRVTRATLGGHFLDVRVDIRAWLNRAGMAVEVAWQEGCRGNRSDGPRFLEVAPVREEALKRFLAHLHGVDWYALGDFDPGGTDGTWWGGELVGATGQRHAFSARNPERTSARNRFVSAHVEVASDALRGLRSTEVLDGLRQLLALPPVHIPTFKGFPCVVRVSGAIERPAAGTRAFLEGMQLERPLVLDLSGLGQHAELPASSENVEAVLYRARAQAGAHVVLPRHPAVKAKATGFELAHLELDPALASCVNALSCCGRPRSPSGGTARWRSLAPRSGRPAR